MGSRNENGPALSKGPPERNLKGESVASLALTEHPRQLLIHRNPFGQLPSAATGTTSGTFTFGFTGVIHCPFMRTYSRPPAGRDDPTVSPRVDLVPNDDGDLDREQLHRDWGLRLATDAGALPGDGPVLLNHPISRRMKPARQFWHRWLGHRP